MHKYPTRLIEVDLPIARISAHARREKSIRHGHISTLHIWWARRPLAACRAVICAALWPDPEDLMRFAADGSLGAARGRSGAAQEGSATAQEENAAAAPDGLTLRPARFLDEARRRMADWAARHYAKASPESHKHLMALGRDPALLDDPRALRGALLDFIADFANWDNSTDPAFLETARALTQAAHEALGGAPGTRPLVVDPFAGGGSIPLEALRVGADAFASDLNPIPVLLNKVVLEYIPKYGQRLADEVRKWGKWVKERAEEELAQFYPKDPPTKDNPSGATPIAYLWARTILSEAPGQGTIPVEVPLMRSLWLAKKANRRRALRWVRDEHGRVKTQTVEVTYCIDGQRTPTRVKRPLLEIFEPKKDSEVEGGTVARGSATCPVTGHTTPVASVRKQLKQRRGGAADARLFAVVTTRDHEQGRFYRLPTKADQAAFDAAAAELEHRERADGTERSAAGRAAGRRSVAAGAEGPAGRQAGKENRRSLVPDEPISLNELRRVSVPIYGMECWGDLFSPRQALAMTTLTRLVREGAARCAEQSSQSVGVVATSDGLAEAVAGVLALAIGKQADLTNSMCAWEPVAQCPRHLFGRQAIGIVWDYAEGVPIGDSSGAFGIQIERNEHILEVIGCDWLAGQVEHASATGHPLPDDVAAAFVTDPPYYDAVPYAYLSDFFYVWMRRTLADVHPALFREPGVPKDDEIVVDRPHQLSRSTKGIEFYERELTRAFAEGRRVLAPAGVGTIVFASKTTASWEAILKAVVDAGFVITGSWPIDTEMETRVAAQGQARLGSSVHIVVRPRENQDGSVRTDDVGEWREVLAELPQRIHAWMPRLAKEGVVGADAIFACLGPALEIFSRYSRVEKASGEAVTLGEYLEQVWAAVSKEALSMLFADADASGLEPDARLTAMWLWTLGAGAGVQAASTKGAARAVAEGEADDSGDETDDDAGAGGRKNGGKAAGGFALEFDAARKIAQGLGAHLDKLPTVLEIRGDTARLLSVAERTRHLFGKDAEADQPRGRRKKRAAQMSLFAELEAVEAQTAGGGWALGAAARGQTTLDRVHQAMILFAAARGEALKRFLVEDAAGQDPRFWKLAQSLSALYPAGTDEKRWVDGVLGRKKGLGL